MTRWPTKPLGEIALTITKGTTPQTIGRQYTNRGIPFLRAENLRNGRIVVDDDTLRIDAETNSLLARSVIQPNDVLLSIAGTIGRAAIVGNDTPEMNCNQAVGIVRLIPGYILPNYLLAWLMTADAQSQMTDAQVTQTVSNLSLGQIGKLRLPMPPLAEQERIVKLLDEADELRNLRAQADCRTADLIPALFHDIFGDPVANPNAWPIRHLEDVVAPGRIVTYGIVQAGPNIPNGIPYIRTGDLKEGVIKVAGVLRTTHEIAESYSRSEVKAGDIVMSIRATVGTTARVPEELDGANLTQGTARISPGSETVADYLLCFLRMPGPQSWIQGQVKGATFREITLGNLRQLPVVLPPLRLQQDFAARVAEIRALETRQAASRRRLDDLFQSMLHRAFNGEL